MKLKGTPNPQRQFCLEIFSQKPKFPAKFGGFWVFKRSGRGENARGVRPTAVVDAQLSRGLWCARTME